MATTIFESIKDSLIHLFKGLYPAFDITCEELPRTRENGGTPAVEDYIFLDIIPAGNETRGPHQTDVSFRIVDKVLHCTFTLAFTDSGPEPESPPLMEELSANINERT